MKTYLQNLHNTGKSPTVNAFSINFLSDTSMPAWWYPMPQINRSGRGIEKKKFSLPSKKCDQCIHECQIA